MSKFLILITTCLLGYVLSDLVFLNGLKDDATAQCGKFTCSNDALKDKKCVQATGDTNKGSRKIAMNSCFKNSTCDTDYDTFAGSVEITKSCKLTPDPVAKKDRYPGEPCDDVHKCKDVPKKQEDGTFKTVENACNAESKRCDGPTEKTQNCQSDETCAAGDYCKLGDTATGDCTAQVVNEGDCKTSWDCINTHVCYKLKCVAAYSFPLGQVFISSDFNPLFTSEGICSTGMSVENPDDKSQLICVGQMYNTEKHPNVSNGLVKCDYGSKCSYNTYRDVEKTKKGETTQLDCACLATSDGQGYCGLAKDNSDQVKNDLVLINNDRHTKSRYEGKIGSNKECTLMESKLFGLMDQCVKDVFGYGECSTNYVKMAFGLLAILYTLF